jgi:hypothetical protein
MGEYMNRHFFHFYLILSCFVFAGCGGGSSAPSISTSETSEACCKICTIGKACGNTCIEATKTCHVGVGCACNASNASFGKVSPSVGLVLKTDSGEYEETYFGPLLDTQNVNLEIELQRLLGHPNEIKIISNSMNPDLQLIRYVYPDQGVSVDFREQGSELQIWSINGVGQ